MAQSKGTASKGTAKKNDTKSKKTNSKSTKASPPPSSPPIRREVTGVVFLFLSVFMFISYFNTDGALIAFFSDLLKGLVGWGFWITAPAFLIISGILLFHRGNPVALRVISMLLLPVVFAAIGNLMFGDYTLNNFDFGIEANRLFEQGQNMKSGGVLGGLLAIGLDMAVSIYGALPMLLVCFVVFILIGFTGGITGALNKAKEHKPVKYDPSMYQQSAAKPGKKAKKNNEADLLPVQTANKIERIPRAVFPVDVPLGEDEEELRLHDLGGISEEPYVSETKLFKKTKVRRKGEEKSSVKVPNLDIPEEEELELPDMAGFREIPVPARTTAKPVTMSAEISDPPRGKKLSRAEVDAEAQAVAEAISASGEKSDYEFPPVSLLRNNTAASIDGRDEIIVNRERLEGAIRSFGISASIVGVIRGPTVTRYDIELDQGVKLARITNLAGDLALALGVINVRIAPIPDKISTVGIEVPNKIVSTVYLREIIESQKFSSAKSKLSFAIGKDIGGECVVGNISKLPHMLIAGTTGSGKSVCMNSLILSLLYKARPDEVRLIMIDPKMVELGIYNGIPHLYVPVVTDPKKAAGALQWSVVEMLKRYRMFSEVGVRDLESYNRHCKLVGEQSLPQVVIVIDELADLMMVASKEVEESICRVAQMGRAAGMHLIIATQRPSADVITGLMKANIPSRIAFAVSSAMESRIILDQSGAEKLVGMGDMLFSPVGCGKPTRIQGAFVSDEEREDIIQFIKEGAGSAQQNSEIEEYMNKAAEDKTSDGGKSSRDDGSGSAAFDEMLPQAAEVVIEMGSCSVSMLQRRVKLGYSRAARIVDQMEELGIVGPYEGAKPRKVLIDRSGWQALQVQLGLANENDFPPDPNPEQNDTEDNY